MKVHHHSINPGVLKKMKLLQYNILESIAIKTNMYKNRGKVQPTITPKIKTWKSEATWFDNRVNLK
jgi:hypothetical protein